MKKIAAAASITAIAWMLAGCGASTPTYGNARAVASAAGFTHCSKDTDTLADASVDCGAARVDWFMSAQSEQAFTLAAKAAASAFSGLKLGAMLYGPNWAVECANAAQCSSIKAKIGGDYR